MWARLRRFFMDYCLLVIYVFSVVSSEITFLI